jgi:hypothetical protein
MKRLLSFVMLAMLAPLPQGCSLFGCGDDVTRRALSPDGQWLAAVFVRNCGATTGFVTYVVIVEAGASPDDDGKVFVAEAGEAPQGPKGGPDVRLRWVGPDRLLVAYDERTEVFFQAVRLRGLTIDYRSQRPTAGGKPG